MFLTLKNRVSKTTKVYSELLNASGLDHIFNPSFAQLGSQLVIAFRAISRPGKAIHAYILLPNTAGQPVQLLDISQHFAGLGVAQVADPKLFQFDNAIWVTFNTGWSRDGNEIYVAPLYPNLGLPLRCDFVGRQKIEKNWAFYEWQGSLRTIYGLGNNGRVLEAKTDPSQTVGSLEMVPVGEVISTWRENDVSIGTQLAFGADAAYLVAHKKFHVLGKRVYVGKVVRLTFAANDVHASFDRKYIFHSFGALLGSKTKRNKNLISCSYFSGFQIISGIARLAYGINDIAFGFAEVGLDEFL